MKLQENFLFIENKKFDLSKINQIISKANIEMISLDAVKHFVSDHKNIDNKNNNDKMDPIYLVKYNNKLNLFSGEEKIARALNEDKSSIFAKVIDEKILNKCKV